MMIVLALAAANLFFLYRHSIRDSIVVNEHAQFLLLHPELYADHRGKFEAYLLTSAEKSGMQRSVDALKAISRMAREGRANTALANVGARNAVAQRGRA
jgi:hypothetical protein